MRAFLGPALLLRIAYTHCVHGAHVCATAKLQTDCLVPLLLRFLYY